MKKSLSILGCGYLGKRLIPLLENSFNLHISTRNSQALFPNIKTYSIDLKSSLTPSLFWESEILVILIPPYENMVSDFYKIKTLFKGQYIIFTSSLSVFAKNQGEITEKTRPLGGQNLIEAEKSLLSFPQIISILRLGGIADNTRKPWKYLEGKMKEYDEWLHLVHTNDCLQALFSLCSQPQEGIFHIVNHQRILKSSFYQTKCKNPPHFGKLLPNAKKISNVKSVRQLGLNYQNL